MRLCKSLIWLEVLRRVEIYLPQCCWYTRFMADLVQCTPNFSEGRDRSSVLRIVETAQAALTPLGGEVRDWSCDEDHNRSVLTFLGCSEAVEAASVACARAAVELLDLRTHRGAHPRCGVIDVLPFTPLAGATHQDVVVLAHRVGSRLSTELALPVNYYGWAAHAGRADALPDLRRLIIRASKPLDPDEGPTPNAKSGRVLVGARGPLVACNMNLLGVDLSTLRRIVDRLKRDRLSLPELTGVRALAIYLQRRKVMQVSMNLTQPGDMTLPALFQYLSRIAAAEGGAIAETEIVGLVPEATLGSASPQEILWNDWRETQILRGL